MRSRSALERMNRLTMVTAAAGAMLLVAGSAWGATLRTWGEGDNGPQTSDDHVWDDPKNWSDNDVPDTSGSSGEIAIIGDTTADRTITTPSTTLTIHGLDWSQSATSSGVSKLVLGGDVTVDMYLGHGEAEKIRFDNDTDSPDNMVLDLNGHTLSLTSWVYSRFENMTIISSEPGGLIRTRLLNGNGPGMVVGPGVTFESVIAEGIQFGTVDYPAHSTILLSAVGQYSTTYGTNLNSIGSLQVGLPDSTGLTSLKLSPYGYAFRAVGNVEFFVPDGNTDQALDLQATPFFIGGNFIDHGPEDGAGYGDGVHIPSGNRYGRIIFNNSPTTPNIVHIPRNTLTNDFFIGNNTEPADTGNIVLTHDLTTTGLVAISANSHLNVADKTVSAGTFAAANGSIFTYGFGDLDDGLIAVTGNLTLSAFTLNLYGLGGNGGGDLVLFTYGGSLIGTPTMTLGSVPVGFSYGGLYYGDGQVWLSSVYLPEPGAAITWVLAAAALSMKRKRIVL